MNAADLSTRYLGLTLRNPLVVAASPLSAYVTTLQELEAAGAAAVVLPSLFEEQIVQEDARRLALGNFSITPQETSNHAAPRMLDYNAGPDSYLRQIELAKKSLSIPVIGSINAASRGGWVNFASLIEQSGADALELNIYFIPTDPKTTSAEVEQRYLEIVSAVRAAVKIPIAVKIGPYFAALPNFALRLSEAGANGMVLFNRYLEPEFDIEKFAIRPQLELSTPTELRLPLRWIGILYQQMPLSLAATSGIHRPEDAIKAVLAGADVAMVASTLIQHGPGQMRQLLTGIQQWMESKKFQSLEEIRGLMSRHTYGKPADFERANYMEAISSFSKSFA